VGRSSVKDALYTPAADNLRVMLCLLRSASRQSREVMPSEMAMAPRF
jgi:hypothetical protein